MALKCKYGTSFYKGQNLYTCYAIGLDNHNKDVQFEDAIGKHEDENSNHDVTALIVKAQNVSYFPTNIITIFKNLNQLEIIDSCLVEIRENDFEHLENLETLKLSRNNISTIHKDAFVNLKNLKALYLNENKINRIHSQTFAENSELELLTLEGNLLTSLHEDTFVTMPKLKELYLLRNKLIELREKLFRNSKELEKIDVSNNELTFIGPNIFEPIRDVIKNFNFSNNVCLPGLGNHDMKIDDFEKEIKENCFPPYLTEYADLIHNLNESLNNCNETLNRENLKFSDLQKAFDGKYEKFSKETEDLNARNLKLQQENEKLKENVENQQNEIKVLEEKYKNLEMKLEKSSEDIIFLNESLHNQSLEMANTELYKQNISQQYFVEKTKAANCSANEIKIIRLINSQVEKIQELEEEKKQSLAKVIQESEDCKMQMENMGKTFAVRETELLNQITESNSKCQSENYELNANLEKCHEDHNGLRQSYDQLYSRFTKCNMNLEKYEKSDLNCDYKTIRGHFTCQVNDLIIPYEFMKLQLINDNLTNNDDVTKLSISDSFVKYINNDFFVHFKNLKTLFITNSKLQYLVPLIESSTLNELSLNGNFINILEANVFHLIGNIESIDLSDNRIETIDETAFYKLENLKELNLKSNKISQLPENVFNWLTEMTHLSLVNNKLERINGELLIRNTKLEVLLLDHNPLKSIGINLLDYSSKLRMVHFHETCVGQNIFNIEETKKRFATQC